MNVIADVVADTCRIFDGEVVEVRPGPIAGLFPESIGGRRTVGTFTACAVCGAGTWARLDGIALCLTCAWLRWRSAELVAWRGAS